MPPFISIYQTYGYDFEVTPPDARNTLLSAKRLTSRLIRRTRLSLPNIAPSFARCPQSLRLAACNGNKRLGRRVDAALISFELRDGLE